MPTPSSTPRKFARLFAASLLASSTAQHVVAPGGVTPYSGGGGRRHGGYVRVSDAPLGFFVGGSTLEALNGVYGPRIDPRNPEALEHLQQKENLGEFAEYVKGGLGAYRHDHSGWWLVHAALAPGSEHSEWVFVDEAGQRRFRHDGNTLIPGSGKRLSQLTPSARAQAPPSESTQIRVQGEVPPLEDGDELPWQLIGVRSRDMLFFPLPAFDLHKLFSVFPSCQLKISRG